MPFELAVTLDLVPEDTQLGGVGLDGWEAAVEEQWVEIVGPVDRRTCPDCMPFIGEVFKADDPSILCWTQGTGMHVMCRHWAEPTTPPDGVAKSPPGKGPTGSDFVEGLIAEGRVEELEAIFGPVRAELLSGRQVTVGELWGEGKAAKTLEQMGYTKRGERLLQQSLTPDRALLADALEGAKSWHQPHNLMIKPDVHKYLLARGHSQVVIDEADRLLQLHGGAAGQQAAARRQIMAAFADRSSSLGAVLRERAALDSAMLDAWERGATSRVQKAVMRAQLWWKDGVREYAGTTYDTWAEMKAAVGAKVRREEGSVVLYRRGKSGQVLESWTTNPQGAVMGRGTKGIGWDIQMTWEEAKAKGYLAQAGATQGAGAPGESEILLVNAKKLGVL